MNDAKYMFEIEGLSSDTSLFTSIQTIGSLFTGVTTAELQIIAEEYYMHSSKKRLSPICRKWVNDAVDLTAFINKVATACITRYGRNWDRIFNAYFKTDYKPLDNYAMREVELPNLTDTTDINTKTDLTNSSKTKVYGFNSDTPVGDNETEVTTTGDKDKNETTSKTTRKGSRTLTREGNIGVTTSMQMLTQEIEGRQYDFWENVFSDIDRLLCFMLRSI